MRLNKAVGQDMRPHVAGTCHITAKHYGAASASKSKQGKVMDTWHPIATAPAGRYIEIIRFPCLQPRPQLVFARSSEGLYLTFPDATHWREFAAHALAAAAGNVKTR